MKSLEKVTHITSKLLTKAHSRHPSPFVLRPDERGTMPSCVHVVPEEVVMPDFFRILKLAARRMESTLDSRLKVLGLSSNKYAILTVLLANKHVECCTLENLVGESHEGVISDVMEMVDRRLIVREAIKHSDDLPCSTLTLSILGHGIARAAEAEVQDVYLEVIGPSHRERTRCVAKIAGLFPEGGKPEKECNLVSIAAFQRQEVVAGTLYGD